MLVYGLLDVLLSRSPRQFRLLFATIDLCSIFLQNERQFGLGESEVDNLRLIDESANSFLIKLCRC